MALKLVHDCPGIAATVFYIDLQVAGKYAGRLMKTAEEHKVLLRQGVPGEILPGPENTLEIIVEHEGRNVRECFDRVILSVGQRPTSGASSLADRMGIPVNEFGFLEPRPVPDNSRTTVPGIYVAGTCSGPKDIEQTLEHAGQTAAAVIADLQKGVLR
jgi:heterodisulfide reductase subunit A2